MAQNIDFYIDVTNGSLVAAGSTANGVMPTLTRNDTYNFRVRLQQRDSANFLRDFDTTGSSIKLGIGGIDDGPSDGQFKLVLNSVTSNAISFNATPAQVLTAISGIAGQATVTTYGSEPYSYLITAVTPNTAMSFGGSNFTLFPTSSVIISTRRFPTSGVQAQQIIKLRRNPAVYSDSFTTAPTNGVVFLTKVQDGSATQNETYKLTVGPEAEGGSLVLGYDGSSTTGVPIGATAASFTEALSAVTGIGAGNISVDSGNNSGKYTISFVRGLGLQNITTALSLDASGVVFGNFLQSSVTLATAELDELFAEEGTDTITPTLEIELTQDGTPKTVYQGSIDVRRDLITTGAVVPAAQASYYTKAEADALFVEDSTSNVDATGRRLYDSSSNLAINYGSRLLVDTGGTTQLSWATAGITTTTATINNDIVVGSVNGMRIGVTSASKIAFFGNTPVSKPTDVNVVSAIATLGLFTNASTTYGVFPNSSRTLTATASLWFNGNIAGNDFHSVTQTITGASINDVVLLGLPSGLDSGLAVKGCVVTNNVVSITALNATNSTINQATATYRITVIGY